MAHTSAVICEFNPLHLGHEALLNRAREMTDGAVIAVMSGNFTQRSECAVYDKIKRAKAAVFAGADLVLELPFPWCSAGAEFFALGGVSVALGVLADGFVFGSESGSTDTVKQISELSESRKFREHLDAVTKADSGAAEAYDAAMKHFGIVLGPNDKLGGEYMRAARRLGADVLFTAVRRMTDEGIYKSASEIREMLASGHSDAGKYISGKALPAYGNDCGIDVDPHRLEELEYLFFRFFSDQSAQITAEGSGGVLGRLFSAARRAETPREFYRSASTKKYTSSRLRRAALFALLGVTAERLSEPPRFTRLLASNEIGREHLSHIRRTGKISVITKPSAIEKLDNTALKQYGMSCQADELYSLCLRSGAVWGEYLRRTPAVI